MVSCAFDPNVLAAAEGFLVADARGRVVGRVERASTTEDGPRLTVRGRLRRRRHVVPATAIEEIDHASGVVALRVGREDLPSL